MGFSRTLLISSSLLLTACEIPSSFTAGNSLVEVDASPSPSTSASTSAVADPATSVCDPFGSTEVASDQNGLLAHLYYPPKSTDQYTDVESYMTNGIEAGLDIYFNQLNVPTRSFSEGFTTQTGAQLQTPQGTPLYEWFGLRFASQIRLGSEDTPGRYQFAVVSDDGAILSIDQGTGLDTLISNPGETQTRMVCAKTGIDMDESTNLPMQLDYFQGPRYEIALMLIWRQVPEVMPGETDNASLLQDPFCGQGGSSLFFDSSTIPSTPNNNWVTLLSRGWKVLSADNYYLPSSSVPVVNPCTSPSPSPTPSPSTTSACSDASCGGGAIGI